MFTTSKIETIAANNGMAVETVIPGKFSEIEYLTVSLKPFVTAFFLMDNETFDFEYSHTYNAKTDKTTKSLPAIFK